MNKYQEAINYVVDRYLDIDYQEKPMNDDTKYALTLQELVERATPKKVKNMKDQLNFKTGDFEYRSGECPVCGKENGCNEFNENEYCRGCGQRLNWEDEE